MNEYDIGDMVRLKTITKNASGVAFNATAAPTLAVKKPDGSTLTPTVTKPTGTGIYEGFVLPDIAGTYIYAFTLAGSEVAYEESKFSVRTRRLS
jgi:uncharacterized protein YfaS (alpha-2-macroglobulin family)